MDSHRTIEKQSGRIEKRTVYTTNDTDWINNKNDWAKLLTIGAIHRETTTKNGTSSEWHYYISSANLTAEEFLSRCRQEWSVESMHWLLDVHFCEDFCRVTDETVQENLNILRKIILNSIRNYKNKINSKAAFSHLMLDCMIDMDNIQKILAI